MSQDFLDQLGELALGSRLKRMSDRMLADAQAVYQHYGMDVQPKWFTLLALLYEKQQVPVLQASQYLGLSQPAVSQFCKQLQQRGLVEVVADAADSRKKIMQLTDEGFNTVSQMQPVWKAVRKAAEDMCKAFENDFFKSLQVFESAHQEKSLLTRTIEHYEETNHD